MRVMTTAALMSALVVGLVSPVHADEAQRAYDACRLSYNTERGSLGSNWAFVAGVSGNRTRCFWRWGGAKANVSSLALTDCRNGGFRRCFVFGASHLQGGTSGWARAISNNGGLSEGTVAERQNEQLAVDLLDSLITGFSAGIRQTRPAPSKPYRPPAQAPSQGGSMIDCGSGPGACAWQ
jgi:hypothetical protein